MTSYTEFSCHDESYADLNEDLNAFTGYSSNAYNSEIQEEDSIGRTFADKVILNRFDGNVKNEFQETPSQSPAQHVQPTSSFDPNLLPLLFIFDNHFDKILTALRSQPLNVQFQKGYETEIFLESSKSVKNTLLHYIHILESYKITPWPITNSRVVIFITGLARLSTGDDVGQQNIELHKRTILLIHSALLNPERLLKKNNFRSTRLSKEYKEWQQLKWELNQLRHQPAKIPIQRDILPLSNTNSFNPIPLHIDSPKSYSLDSIDEKPFYDQRSIVDTFTWIESDHHQ